MSPDNVEITRGSVDAFNRRDLDAWLADFDPEIVWMDLLPDLRMEAKDYIDAGEYVIIPARMSGHTPDSAADVMVDEVYLNRCRDGKIVEVREYRTRDEAFEAVALAEQDARADF